MNHSHVAIPRSAKFVLRTIGVINAALGLLGASYLIDSVYRVFTKTYRSDSPYFLAAFAGMGLIDGVLLACLMGTAFRFIQTKLSSINIYSILVLILFLHDVIIGNLWAKGIQVGAATGMTGIGLAPFEFFFLLPYLYPLASIIVLQVIKQRCGAQRSPINV
jgi:hypothetical protein